MVPHYSHGTTLYVCVGGNARTLNVNRWSKPSSKRQQSLCAQLKVSRVTVICICLRSNHTHTHTHAEWILLPYSNAVQLALRLTGLFVRTSVVYFTSRGLNRGRAVNNVWICFFLRTKSRSATRGNCDTGSTCTTKVSAVWIWFRVRGLIPLLIIFCTETWFRPKANWSRQRNCLQSVKSVVYCRIRITLK